MLLSTKSDIKFKDFRFFQWQNGYLKNFFFKDILYKSEFKERYYFREEARYNGLFMPHLLDLDSVAEARAFFHFPFFFHKRSGADPFLFKLFWLEMFAAEYVIKDGVPLYNNKALYSEEFLQSQVASNKVRRRQELFDEFTGEIFEDRDLSYFYDPELQKPFEDWLISSGNSVRYPLTVENLEDELKYGDVSATRLIYDLNAAMSIGMTLLSGLAYFHQLALDLSLTDEVKNRGYKTFKYAMDSLLVIDELYILMLKYEIPIYKDYALSPPYSGDVDFKKLHPDYLLFPGYLITCLLPGTPGIRETYGKDISLEDVFSFSREVLIRSIIDSILEIPHMETLISSFMFFDKEKPSSSVQDYLYSYINPLSTETLRYLLVNPPQTVETLNRIYVKLYRIRWGSDPIVKK